MHLYWTTQEHCCTVRMTLKLRDDIDRDMIVEAVAAAQKRYPYMCMKVQKYVDADNSEFFGAEDNDLPWVVTPTIKPARLLSPESNFHLLAFSAWDNYLAIDFFHGLTDGMGAYNVLRTLLYEYCRRRYDNTLSREGIYVAGDAISPKEYEDPALLPHPEKLNPVIVPSTPRAINLYADGVTPISSTLETVFLQVDEEQMMKCVSSHGTTPAKMLTLVMARAVARLHQDCKDAAPMAILAINLRKPLGTPLTYKSIVSGIRMLITEDIQKLSIDEQAGKIKDMVAEQASPDNVTAMFWRLKDCMDMFDKMPTAAARQQAMQGFSKNVKETGTFCMSYVGKSNFGAAEQYVIDMSTEIDTDYALMLELNATGGRFNLSLMQRFSSDSYLDAIIDELRQLGLNVSISWRRPTIVAPIFDFYHD